MNEQTKIALIGNPNVGKSTIFNALTGLKQHTGNWTGKTVESAKGTFKYEEKSYTIVDTPGTYLLDCNSSDEEVTKDFLIYGESEKIIVVIDASRVMRGIRLVLQTLEISKNVVLCVNLIDEAKKDGIKIDTLKLSKILGIEVVATNARNREGIYRLKKAINKDAKSTFELNYSDRIENAISEVIPYIKTEKLPKRFFAIELLKGNFELVEKFGENPKIIDTVSQIRANLEKDIDIKNEILKSINEKSKQISKNVVTKKENKRKITTEKIDKILTGKYTAIPCMLIFMCVIFYITITFANYPSTLLSNFFTNTENFLYAQASKINIPIWICDLIFKGAFRTLGWIVSVMLPPMAIFFPFFTLLEDWGYLPRVAFNLDRCFKGCASCGKQSLTMCMGFGCNATGVVGARIINTKKEKLLAIITNSFVPCNGKFPTIIMLISLFFVGSFATGFLNALILTLIIIFCVFLTLLATKILSKTILKGEKTSFVLELPPYRKPQICKTLVRSIFDRTIFVLARAIAVAIPAGILIWCLSNIYVNDMSVLLHIATFLDPFAKILGLDGIILLAFILGLPANEIVLPIALMMYTSSGTMEQIGDISKIGEILISNGWTFATAICFIIFSLFHSPCLTTLITIKKETNSIKYTLLSAIFPTLFGIILCMFVNLIFVFV